MIMVFIPGTSDNVYAVQGYKLRPMQVRQFFCDYLLTYRMGSDISVSCH